MYKRAERQSQSSLQRRENSQDTLQQKKEQNQQTQQENNLSVIAEPVQQKAIAPPLTMDRLQNNSSIQLQAIDEEEENTLQGKFKGTDGLYQRVETNEGGDPNAKPNTLQGKFKNILGVLQGKFGRDKSNANKSTGSATSHDTLQAKLNASSNILQSLPTDTSNTADYLQAKFKESDFAVQRMVEEEKANPLQGKFQHLANIVQRQGTGEEEEDILQGKFSQEPIQKQEAQPNNTGLPDNLKSGIENLSGYSMDDVNVHYNSSKPAQLQAHAYAQGTDIHLGPGQEKHLPHEAWHVVQQKQGRVKPTMQLKGIGVNDDVGLEREADVMGEKATSSKSSFLNRKKNVLISEKIAQGKFGLEIETGIEATIHGISNGNNVTRKYSTNHSGNPIALSQNFQLQLDSFQGRADNGQCYEFVTRPFNEVTETRDEIVGHVDAMATAATTLANSPSGALLGNNYALQIIPNEHAVMREGNEQITDLNWASGHIGGQKTATGEVQATMGIKIDKVQSFFKDLSTSPIGGRLNEISKPERQKHKESANLVNDAMVKVIITPFENDLNYFEGGERVEFTTRDATPYISGYMILVINYVKAAIAYEAAKAAGYANGKYGKNNLGLFFYKEPLSTLIKRFTAHECEVLFNHSPFKKVLKDKIFEWGAINSDAIVYTKRNEDGHVVLTLSAEAYLDSILRGHHDQLWEGYKNDYSPPIKDYTAEGSPLFVIEQRQVLGLNEIGASKVAKPEDWPIIAGEYYDTLSQLHEEAQNEQDNNN